MYMPNTQLFIIFQSFNVCNICNPLTISLRVIITIFASRKEAIMPLVIIQT